jgi:hypothetical protein
MTHEIIKTDNYLLVVDDSEIKKGDWFYNRVLSQSIKVQGVWLDKVDNLNSNLETFKVIAHLPLNNAPILEGVDVLPPTEEDDVEKMAFEYSGDLEDTISNVSYDAYIKGYNKAREKYKYTEEDMENAITIAKNSMGVDNDGETCYSHLSTKDIIQSLSQPKMPTHFEVFYDIDTLDSEGKVYQMTTTNNLGQAQWVGKYIYA